MKKKKEPVQLEMFEDFKIEKPAEAKPSEELVLKIKKGAKPKLNKEQQLFNRLVKQIDALKAKIELVRTNAPVLGAFHAENIIPVNNEIGNVLFEMAAMFDNFIEQTKGLTQKQTNMVSQFISGLCDTALEYIEPNDLQKALYDKYNEESYDDAVASDIEDMYADFREFMKQETGVDMGEMNFDPNDMESTMNFANAFKEKVETKILEDEQKEKTTKKAKKQLEKEQQAFLEMEVKKKSIRSVYISLAKVLHPDTETDEKIIREKAELMKKVTAAYKENDLATLLRLELEWIHRTSEKLDQLDDEKLHLYNDALQEQVYELEDELGMMVMNPAFANFARWMTFSEKYALREMKGQARYLREELTDIKREINYLTMKNKSKKAWLEFAEDRCDYRETTDSDTMLEELMNELKKRGIM